MQPLKLGKYRHYKNRQIYEVIGLARHSETLEEMVIYRGLYHCEKWGANPVWVRPLSLFCENVTQDIPRFEFIES